MSTRPRCLFTFALVLSVAVCALPAFASGQREDDFAKARELIAEQKYNDAILLLTSAVKKDSSRFDEAQALFRQIDVARNLYNTKVAELIKVFNEGDLEQAYLVLKELENLDKAPNQRTLDSQAYARETATIVYNNSRFRDLMDRALAQLNAKQYAQAVTTYLSGFDLGYDTFQANNLGNIVSTRVLALRNTMQSAAQHFVELDQKAGGIATIDAKALDDPSAVAAAVDRLGAVFGQIATDRTSVAAAAQQLLDQRQAVLMQRTNLTDVYFITYLTKYAQGRGTNGPQEGILYAIDSMRQSVLGDAFGAIAARMNERFTRAENEFDASSLEPAQTDFAASAVYAENAERVAALWDARLATDPSFALTSSNETYLQQAVPDFLSAYAIQKAADTSQALIADRRKLADLLASAQTTTAVDALVALRGQTDGIAQQIVDSQATWTQLGSHFGQFAAQKFKVDSSLQVADRMVKRAASAGAMVVRTEVALIDRINRVQIPPIEQGLTAQKKAFDDAQSLINGVPLQVTEDAQQITITAHYPSRGFESLNAGRASLVALGQRAQALLDALKAERPELLADPALQADLKIEEALVASIDQIRAASDAALNAAQQAVFQAQRFRQDGENVLRNARDDIGRGVYADARNLIQTAADRLDRSLAFEENPEVRNERDVLIPSLSRQITDAENNLVVRDVRDYINQGKDLYSRGEYGPAQDVFLRAQARWRITNAEDNPEISTWLKYIDTALSINSGRVIEPTDPLYAEMTQVLNLAQSDYEHARQLVAGGRSTDARSYLADAQQKLLYVQVPFPFNEQARVLALRILQLTDPTNFAATLRTRFNQAMGSVRTNPQDAYLSLKDLQVIDPNYPGLANALNTVEIAIGVRRPPPDPAKIQEAVDLYQKAFDIVRTNVRAQYPIAIAYLNRAIELNPDNQQAAALKDRLSIDTGGATTVVLSSAAQDQFRQAEEQYIAKSYYEALKTVNQLLRDPANQNYQPLLELKRRIESKI